MVSFDPNGGENAPRDQIIEGGKTAVEPKDPVEKAIHSKDGMLQMMMAEKYYGILTCRSIRI